MKRQIKLIAAATAALVITGNAAVVSTSTTAPTADGLDEYNLTAGTGQFKWFNEGNNHDLGQTFTPDADAALTSFTILMTAKNDDDGPDTVDFRLGTITRPLGIFTFTDIITPETSPQNGDWAAGDYVTYTMDTPEALTGGVEYGVILKGVNFGNWNGPGIPYSATTGNVLTDGVGIYGGNDDERPNNDLVFHANLDAAVIPEPTTTALLGLGGLALIFRRRK